MHILMLEVSKLGRKMSVYQVMVGQLSLLLCTVVFLPCLILTWDVLCYQATWEEAWLCEENADTKLLLRRIQVSHLFIHCLIDFWTRQYPQYFLSVALTCRRNILTRNANGSDSSMLIRKYLISSDTASARTESRDPTSYTYIVIHENSWTL